MCGAGRKIICPDAMSRTTWHTPCTEPGFAAWQIALGSSQHVTLLCAAHDAQVRGVPMPWMKQAVPLARHAERGWLSRAG